MADVVVVGAGPAGLMAAWSAAKAGHRVVVLEASDRVGGMACSFSVGGLRVDVGSHRLHPAAPAATLELCRELLGDDLQVRPRNGRIRMADRWVGFPLRFGELVRSLPPLLAARLVVDSAVTVVRSLLRVVGVGRVPDTFAEEISARLGPTVHRLFYGPYARKLYGLTSADLDGELARRRVSASSPVDIARRLLRASRPEGRQFLYPRRGYGQIVEELAERAVGAGVDLRLGVAVERIEVADGVGGVGPVRLVAVGESPVVESLVADVVLSTIPASSLARVLDPAPSVEVLAALQRQRVRAMLLVYLVLDQNQYTPFDAHYLAGPESIVARLSEPKNYRDSTDDPEGRTVLCAEIACWPDDDIAALAPSEIGERVADELEKLGLPPVDPVAVETLLVPSVYPVFDREGRGDRRIIDRWLVTPGPVLSLGRQGLGVLDNLHHVLDMGVQAAAIIGPDGAVDWTAWGNALQRFAEHTVED